jgi:hypothetical protein
MEANYAVKRLALPASLRASFYALNKLGAHFALSVKKQNKNKILHLWTGNSLQIQNAVRRLV